MLAPTATSERLNVATSLRAPAAEATKVAATPSGAGSKDARHRSKILQRRPRDERHPWTWREVTDPPFCRKATGKLLLHAPASRKASGRLWLRSGRADGRAGGRATGSAWRVGRRVAGWQAVCRAKHGEGRQRGCAAAQTVNRIVVLSVSGVSSRWDAGSVRARPGVRPAATLSEHRRPGFGSRHSLARVVAYLPPFTLP